MKKIIPLILIFLILGCSEKQSWSLFFYKNPKDFNPNKTSEYFVDRFSSFDECKNFGAVRKNEIKGSNFSCKLNCKEIKLGNQLDCEDSWISPMSDYPLAKAMEPFRTKSIIKFGDNSQSYGKLVYKNYNIDFKDYVLVTDDESSKAYLYLLDSPLNEDEKEEILKKKNEDLVVLKKSKDTAVTLIFQFSDPSKNINSLISTNINISIFSHSNNTSTSISEMIPILATDNGQKIDLVLYHSDKSLFFSLLDKYKYSINFNGKNNDLVWDIHI